MGSPLSFSFELFPPRTPEGVAKLPAVDRPSWLRAARLFLGHAWRGRLRPGWHLRDSADRGRAHAASRSRRTSPVWVRRAPISRRTYERYRDAGVKRIVALRGDLPATAMSAAAPGEFHYASELVSFIRETHGERIQDRSGGLSRDASAGGEARARTSITSGARWRPARTRR